MKTKMKKLITFILVLSVAVSFIACGEEENEGLTELDHVYNAVYAKGVTWYMAYTIGGKELKSSKVTITSYKKVSDTQYNVYGKIYATDLYGTQYSNTFDCTVSWNDTKWKTSSFKTNSSTWSKE